ncbi:MAG: hypothetical protein AAF205_08085 [Pseudomonadota bacterium]
MTIRKLDAEVKRNARLAAAENGRSLEAELRTLLERTYRKRTGDRAERVRAMTGAKFVEHLVRTAAGAGDDAFENGSIPLRDVDL